MFALEFIEEDFVLDELRFLGFLSFFALFDFFGDVLNILFEPGFYVFGGLGLLSALGSVICGFAVIYQKIASGVDISGNPLLIVTAVSIIATIQFILMGLLAELLVRTYHESQNRPTYVIREIIESVPKKED